MRLTFIIPNMSWLYDYKAQFPLGILYIATSFKECGWEVDIFDTNVCNIDDLPFADVYGFSVVYNTYESCIDFVKIIRERNKRSLLIAGGVYPTIDYTKFEGIFDCVFIGEGENTIKDFNRDFALNDVKKIYKQQQTVNLSKQKLDRSILPDDYIRTSSIFTGGENYCEGGSTSIMFSRGCSSNCVFCCSPKLYNRKVRFRAVESIVEEINQIIQDYDIRQFRIQDDTFTLNLSYLKKLTDKLKPLGIYYRCSTRADRINKDVIDMLYESGCREIGMGVEAADDTVLHVLKKNETVLQMTNVIKIIREYPIKIRCFFMMGYPFDTENLMYKNIQFIEDNELDNVVTCNLIPFPGTELYDEREKFGITEIKSNCCMNFASHIPLQPNFSCKGMTDEEHIGIMKIFYDYMLERGFIR